MDYSSWLWFYYPLQREEAVARRCSVKKVLLEISQNPQENTCVTVSFLIKLQLEVCNFIKKETLAQVFSCEFCEISKNIFFKKHLRVTASEYVILSPIFFMQQHQLKWNKSSISFSVFLFSFRCSPN